MRRASKLRPTARLLLALRPLLASGMLVLLGACADARPAPRLLVLGLDGMDPQILTRLMDAGRMPHLRALARRGGFSELATTAPPQSPVAWSTFITGLPPAQHGIFDFVHRDAGDLTPYLSTTRRRPDGHMELQRRGTPFWDILVSRGISATIFKVPANFPPSSPPELGGCRCLYRAFAGMGTPDLLGSYGTFTLYTGGAYRVPDHLDAAADTLPGGGRIDVPGGRIISIAPQDGWALLPIHGPELEGAPRQAEAELLVDAGSGAVQIAVDRDAPLLLAPGEWSDWQRVDFGRHPGRLSRVTGIARFYLASIDPLRLYLTPVNIDPGQPLMAVSVPVEAAAELAEEVGLYYTQGMPGDTKALDAGVFDYDEFLTQLSLTVEERERQLRAELERFDTGLLFFYVHSLDQLCHMLWRTTSSTHPGYRPEYARLSGVIDDHYGRLDRLVGMAVAELGNEGDVIVMSDHGFAPFERAVNLNTWLVEQGRLVLDGAAPGDRPNFLAQGETNWERSEAYALGLNGLYLNLAGREAYGSVPATRTDSLLSRIEADLLSLRDPVRGAHVVSRVYRVDRPNTPFGDVSPDLLVGYARGYRSSGASAIGTVEPDVLADNLSPWSGDHCMAAEEVPGILVTSRSIELPDPGLADVPVTILRYYDLPAPPEMEGRPFWTLDSHP